MSFENKHIIVTGASGGMGKEIVKQLLETGAKVSGFDISTERLSDLKENNNFNCSEGDLLDENFVKSSFKEAIEKYGDLYGLVNAAGIGQSTMPIEDIDMETYNKTMDINMKMVFLTCREAVRNMRPRKEGSIVNIGSVSTTRPRPGMQVYIGSKGAVESFTKALALEVAPDQINVNTLHPGPSDTNMLGEFAGVGADVDEMKETVFKQSVPLGRLIEPIDIAMSVKFLLSSEAKIVTGAVLHVDGGRSV